MSDVEPERTPRSRLIKTLCVHFFAAAMAVALSWLPGVSLSTVVMPLLVVVGALTGATIAAHHQTRLTPALACALSSWTAASLYAASGGAMSELRWMVERPPELPWLYRSACQSGSGALLLLCPAAFAFDLVLALAVALLWLVYGASWALRTLGGPILFGLAGAAFVTGALAYLRHRRGSALRLPSLER